MGVYKHGCGITRILIGDVQVLPDARHGFDWLVGNHVSVHQENLIQSRRKKPSIFLHLFNYFYFISKAIEDFFWVYIAGMAQW